MKEVLYKEQSFLAVGAAMEVHRELGPGFLEVIYQGALAHEFKLRNIPFKEQVRLPVMYKGVTLGEYVADFVVDDKLILEIKCVSFLNSHHLAQVVHYLAATGYRLAILINFGSESLQYQRVVR